MRSGGVLARDALGVGLRPVHVDALDAEHVGVDFLELLVENHVGASDIPLRRAERLARRYPMVGHGVGLDLVGADPLDEAHLAAIADLVRRLNLSCLTEHLCWSASRGRRHHELLPIPFDLDLIPWAAQRLRRTRDVLGVPVGVENVSAYVGWARDTVSEWTFLRALVEEADAHLLVDVNNLFVSAHNDGLDPHAALDAIPWDRVLYVHLAGHRLRPDGLRHDTHDQPLDPGVLALYRDAWVAGGPFPTLLEWDAEIPPLPRLLDELDRARRARAT